MIDNGTLLGILTVMISGLALALAWWKAPQENRKLEADTDAKVSEAALALLKPMQERIAELEKSHEKDKLRLAEHERRIGELECELREERATKADVVTGAQRLFHQVESLGGIPVYRPPVKPGEE
jgi:uncharacterized protein HemX